MENKNLDGQLSLDGQLDDAAPASPTREFQIGKPQKEEALIFEVEKPKREQKAEQLIAEPVVEELILGAKPEPKREEPKSEAYQPSSSEQRRRSLYVPRFTEVSEKHRRMIDPRIRSVRAEISEAPKAEMNDAVSEPLDYSDVDPTAEMEYPARNPVFVNVTPKPEEPEMLNVFKFAIERVEAEEAKPEPKVESEPTEEEERENIERLIAKEEEPADEEICETEENVAEDAVAEEETDESSEFDRESYTLPDPNGAVRIEEYNDGTERVREEIAPEGVKEDEPSTDRKHLTEFTHQSQRDAFKDRFLDLLMAAKVRIGAIGVFAVLLLGFEFFASIGALPVTVLKGSTYHGTMALIEILFISSILVLTAPELARAFKYLVKGRLLPELGLLAGYLVQIIYLIVVLLVQSYDYPLYGFIFAVCALSAVFATYYRTNGDFLAFKQVSQNSVKKILDVKLTRELEDENVALDGIVDEYNSRTSRIYRTAFVADFFERTAVPTEQNQQTVIMLAVPFAAAIVSAVVCFFIPGGILSAASSFALVFSLGAPAFALLSRKLSYLDSQKAALSDDSAMIGEQAYFDFSAVDVIAFEDTEIFGEEDVNLKRFMLYGDRDNIEKAMRQMYSLFSVVGGPLYKIFAKALDNRVRHAPATAVSVEADGVCGNLGSKVIAAGTEEYMRRHGIAVPDGAAKQEFGIDTTKVMYAAEDGEIYAKFYIRYSFSEEFTMLLPELKREHIVPLIYTSDPNLSNELLKTLTAGTDCMRVVKKLEPTHGSDKIYRRVSAGVVTYGDKINAINTILLARKHRDFIERASITELYAISLAAAAGIILSVFGVTLPSIVYGLWHIAWCLVLSVASKRVFSVEKKEKDNK